ncbi:MAG TPA: helix-turn-helix transcriptional regulator [Bosea sp. (in: a-proteobacteria)]
MDTMDGEWFRKILRDQDKSTRGLARHLKVDGSAVSRMFSGQRKMKMHEASAIASFLAVPVSEVLKHAGVSIDLDGIPSRVVLAATINERGDIARLSDPSPLPQAVMDRAHAAIAGQGNGKIVAAQVRAASGPLAVLDDAVVLFKYTDSVDPGAIGSLSICRLHDGRQILARIDRARKTGEARIINAAGDVSEVVLHTATPVLAIIP